MNVSCYLNKEEMEFFKDYPKGWLKTLVLKEMRTAASREEETSQVVMVDDVTFKSPLTREEREKMLEWYQKTIDNPNLEVHTHVHPGGSITTVRPRTEEVDEERAREHFPPKLAFPSGTSKTPAYVPEEPVKDVFGPRLKR